MDLQQFLKTFFIFQDLSTEEFGAIGAIFKERTYPKGAYLFRQDDAPDHLFLLETGTVQVFRTVNGMRQNLSSVGAGETLGELSLFGAAVHTAAAVTTSEVVSYVASGADFAKLLADNVPGIGKIMGRMMEATVRRFHLLESRTLEDAAERASEDTTAEGRLMQAIAKKETVRMVIDGGRDAQGREQTIDSLFQIVDMSNSLGAPLLRLKLEKEAGGREYIIPLSSIHYFAFRDSRGKFGDAGRIGMRLEA
ncbi:MAG: cyclic nucleotide-binding domain-containing protein [Candidatus Wallbacteria bacterium]|nr:cyclic nucleotide-binding domain-containing protein [Candidatus Wallbacteria bacterium]